mgnify:CR=1 FL=1
MSDLVERLRQKYPDTPHHRDSLHSEAADRLEQIERVLAQAREALECATKHHTTTSLPLAIERFGTREAAQAFGMRTWMERIPNAIAAIDEALNTTNDRR